MLAYSRRLASVNLLRLSLYDLGVISRQCIVLLVCRLTVDLNLDVLVAVACVLCPLPIDPIFDLLGHDADHPVFLQLAAEVDLIVLKPGVFRVQVGLRPLRARLSLLRLALAQQKPLVLVQLLTIEEVVVGKLVLEFLRLAEAGGGDVLFKPQEEEKHLILLPADLERYW